VLALVGSALLGPPAHAAGGMRQLLSRLRPGQSQKFKLPPAPGKTVRVGGMALHYVEAGRADAPPLVLVHGMMSSTHVWSKVRDELARDHRLLMIDLPNHGYSDRDGRFSMSLDDQARLLGGFLDELKIDQASVLGHSMGGGIAASFAAHNPHRVDKLVLADSLSYGFKMPLKARLATMPIIGGFLLKHVYNRGLMADYMRKDVYHDASAVAQQDIDTMYAHFDSPTARAAAHRAGLAAKDTRALASLIPRIKAPTLVLWGKHDRLLPPALGERLEREIPVARLTLIDGAGHEPMNEQPQAFTAAVRGFLSE
jgi:pimeloyl-ACP methyl ester carboxylesterase